jgi:hypothetical protein
VVQIIARIPDEDRTWDFAHAKRIWDHFESFPSRVAPGESSRPLFQTIDIRVMLEVAWTSGGHTHRPGVELIRRWKIRRLPLASTVSVEPIAIEKNMWKNLHLHASQFQLQSGLASFFVQAYPELDRFVDVQYGFPGYQEQRICRA